jgi:phage shock protein PspC (stress-responsive transcriptional regulator)
VVVRSPGDRDPSERPRRLARAEQNHTFFGVAAGIGRRYGLDPTLVRIGFVLWALA